MGEAEEPIEDQEELKVPLWLKIIFLVFVIGSVWGIYELSLVFSKNELCHHSSKRQ